MPEAAPAPFIVGRRLKNAVFGELQYRMATSVVVIISIGLPPRTIGLYTHVLTISAAIFSKAGFRSNLGSISIVLPSREIKM
jgi:hypothetical protein